MLLAQWPCSLRGIPPAIQSSLRRARLTSSAVLRKTAFTRPVVISLAFNHRRNRPQEARHALSHPSMEWLFPARGDGQGRGVLRLSLNPAGSGDGVALWVFSNRDTCQKFQNSYFLGITNTIGGESWNGTKNLRLNWWISKKWPVS